MYIIHIVEQVFDETLSIILIQLATMINVGLSQITVWTLLVWKTRKK